MFRAGKPMAKDALTQEYLNSLPIGTVVSSGGGSRGGHVRIARAVPGGVDALAQLIARFTSPDVDLSPQAVDNHAMGTIFEELVRRFNEENNEEAGEHWTPRDAVRLKKLLQDHLGNKMLAVLAAIESRDAAEPRKGTPDGAYD